MPEPRNAKYKNAFGIAEIEYIDQQQWQDFPQDQIITVNALTPTHWNNAVQAHEFAELMIALKYNGGGTWEIIGGMKPRGSTWEIIDGTGDKKKLLICRSSETYQRTAQGYTTGMTTFKLPGAPTQGDLIVNVKFQGWMPEDLVEV